MNKKLFSAAATLSGTIIGAGILGLPFVFSKAGFFHGLFWVILFGIVMYVTYLYLSEVYLRTNGHHQLPGLAEKYLGKKGKYIMLIAMTFGIYSSLTAYLIGEGQSLSILFLGSTEYSIYFTIAFWLLLSLLLEGGIERLKKIEFYGLIIISIIIIGIFLFYFNAIDFGHLTYTNPEHFFLPLGVTLFALLGFASIPEVRDELRGSEKLLKKAILIGVLIPVILYIIFAATFVGVLGRNVSEIATLSFGPLIVILGIFTMLTSYFALSFSLKDVCRYDLKVHHTKTFLFTSVLPLLLFIFISFIKWDNFIIIIGLAGVISGGITGILCLLMNYQAKITGKRKPEYEIPINIPIIIIMSLIFVLGVILQIYYT